MAKGNEAGVVADTYWGVLNAMELAGIDRTDLWRTGSSRFQFFIGSARVRILGAGKAEHRLYQQILKVNCTGQCRSGKANDLVMC